MEKSLRYFSHMYRSQSLPLFPHHKKSNIVHVITLIIAREVAKEGERLVEEGRKKNKVCHKLLGIPKVSFVTSLAS